MITTPTANASQSQGQGSTGNNHSSSRAMRSIGQLSLDDVGQAFNRRRMNAITILSKKKNRQMSSLQAINNENGITNCTVELDSHADTCGVNDTAKILEYSGQVAEVSGFANTLDSIKDVPIVKAAIVCDIPNTGETVVLIINQALYFSDQLSHILINPNHLRSNDIIIMMC
jgi:hypothetical protein